MRHSITLMFLLSAMPLLASAEGLLPSRQLLDIAKVSNIEISDKVKIKKVECDNSLVISLKAIAHIKNVNMTKAAIETNNLKKQKLLFTVFKEGDVKAWNSLVSVQLDISEYNLGVSNIWVFFETKDKTYTNSMKFECNVVK